MTTDSTIPPSPVYGLGAFVADVEAILTRRRALPVTVKEVSECTFRLVADGSWLAPEHREPAEDGYARHVLHKDRDGRFVVLALVWRPGQGTPIHDHACWGVMGILENGLHEVGYERLDDGSRPGYAELRELTGGRVQAGSTSYLLPPYREIHAIGNDTDAVTISIHVYGRDIDQVNVFDPDRNEVRVMQVS